jgi:hypothetical protein
MTTALAVAVMTIAGVAGLTVAHADSATSSVCPVGWACQDIGGATPAGGQSLTDGTWQVEGGGADIWGQSDSFHLISQPLTTDGTVSTQVVSQSDTDQNAKAGVMFRASTDANSAYYGVFLTPSHGLAVQYRSADAQAATNAGGNATTAPSFVQAVRVGTTFTAYTSPDGLTWTKVSGSTKTVPGLTGTVLAGLAVTSHNPGAVSTVTFGPLPGSTPSTTTTTTTTTTSPPTTTTSPPTTTTVAPTTTTTTTQGSGGTGGGTSTGGASVCGTALCVDGSAWAMYGATVYNPGLQPIQSGIKDPSGTVALAEQAHLNTIRITDFLNVTGNPATAPFDETKWRSVDAMIAAAGAAGLHVDLGLADYRATLWNSCVDPYTADWSAFVSFVANRVNTVTHLVYKDDPTIAFVSVAGEPLPVGTHTFTAKTTGQPCTLSYSTADLTGFYAATTSEWTQQDGTVLVNSGGLGYLNESHAGIDWQSIFSLPTNAFCDIKTYGGMQAWAPNAAAYCHSIGKPIIDEEFGWQQNAGDAQRAQLYDTMVAQLRSMGFAGSSFWNLGYQLAPTSYEVNPSTPLTFAAVAGNAP